MTPCPVCSEPVVRKPTGRPPVFCSPACRKQAELARLELPRLVEEAQRADQLAKAAGPHIKHGRVGQARIVHERLDAIQKLVDDVEAAHRRLAFRNVKETP